MVISDRRMPLWWMNMNVHFLSTLGTLTFHVEAYLRTTLSCSILFLWFEYLFPVLTISVLFPLFPVELGPLRKLSYRQPRSIFYRRCTVTGIYPFSYMPLYAIFPFNCVHTMVLSSMISKPFPPIHLHMVAFNNTRPQSCPFYCFAMDFRKYFFLQST